MNPETRGPSIFDGVDDLPKAPVSPDRRGWVRRTILEALALLAINLPLGLLILALRLDFLRASDANVEGLEMLRDLSPWLLLGVAALLAPLVEEALFRGLPRLAYRAADPQARNRVAFWAVGSLPIIVFAWLHSLGGAVLTLPIPQLLLGLWAWKVVNERGLRYAILLHGTYNLVPALVAVLAPPGTFGPTS